MVLLATCVVPAGAQKEPDPTTPLPYLAAFDLRTGEQQWRNESPRPGIWRVDFEAHGLVYAEESNCIDGESSYSDPASLVAFDSATGRERWHTTVGETYGEFAAIGVANNIVVVRRRNGDVDGLDAKNGQRLWTLPGAEPGYVGGTPDLVLLTGGGLAGGRELRAYDRLTGALRWTYEGSPPFSILQLVMATNDTVVVRGFARVGNDLRALDLATGHERWSTPSAQKIFFPIAHSPLLIALGYPMPGDAGTIIAFDVATLTQRWSVPISTGGTRALPRPESFARGVVLFGAQSEPGYVRALDAGTGALRWERTGRVGVIGTSRGLSIISGPHGLTAVHTASGKTRWTAPLPKLSKGSNGSLIAGERLFASGGCRGFPH